MLLVLDSNIYIFALGPRRKPSCETLLNKVVDTLPLHSIRIPRLIVQEVKRNLSSKAFGKFVGIISSLAPITEDISVPLELGIKYKLRGFKLADAFIAAFAESVRADVLVSENRHFLLSRQGDLPFKILTAEDCLKLLDK